jgi:hypothetical protein
MEWGSVLEHLDRIGAVAVCLIVTWMIATGRLVTRREADDIRADRDTYRETAHIERETRIRQGIVIDEHVRTTAAAIESIKREAEKG